MLFFADALKLFTGTVHLAVTYSSSLSGKLGQWVLPEDFKGLLLCCDNSVVGCDIQTIQWETSKGEKQSQIYFVLVLHKVFNLSLLEGNCPNKRHIKALRVAPGHSCLKTEFQFAPSVHFKFTKFSNYIQSMIV